MISRWKVALISSIVFGFASSTGSNAATIRSANYAGSHVLPASQLARGSYLKSGAAFSDSLLSLEVNRIDSLYFSRGYLAVDIDADTSSSRGGITVLFTVHEGEATTVGKISVSGAESIGDEAAAKLIRPGRGERFDPFALGRSLSALLVLLNQSGYPFAQVWLTGFSYSRERNEVDIAVSVAEGDRARISHVTFEGITKTDSAVALRTSRLKLGTTYREGGIAAARDYIRASGYFESVGEARVERRSGGAVEVTFPVKDIPRANLFQGAFGFSRTDRGNYVLNGAVELELRNIAGTGRNAHFDWLNNGENYSDLNLRFREPFVFSTPMSLEAELSQVIQDSVYIWYSGGLYAGFPLGPGVSIVAGAAADRNVPDNGPLVRSVRERFRLGFERKPSDRFGVAFHVEGAHRKSYFRGNRTETDGQLLYDVQSEMETSAFGDQTFFVRVVSRGVFSTGNVPLAEMFPLGGATTLRGYRENQFRGEKIAFANLEYRIGAGGWLFLFDDVGAFWRRDEGAVGKNGAGFGLRAASPVGTVVLSFAVGERFSLEDTLIHIVLSEKF
jgi:outer membrane protein insertion porin family